MQGFAIFCDHIVTFAEFYRTSPRRVVKYCLLQRKMLSFIPKVRLSDLAQKNMNFT